MHVCVCVCICVNINNGTIVAQKCNCPNPNIIENAKINLRMPHPLEAEAGKLLRASALIYNCNSLIMPWTAYFRITHIHTHILVQLTDMQSLGSIDPLVRIIVVVICLYYNGRPVLVFKPI